MSQRIKTLEELLSGNERTSPAMSASGPIIEYVAVKALLHIGEQLEKIADRLDPDYGK